MKRWTTLLALLLLAACTRERTQIILQIRTNMTQGEAGELRSVAVRVYSEGIEDPHHDRVYELGTAGGSILLPTQLGLVPDERRDGAIRVEVDARDSSGAVLFTKRALARYVPERTLLLDIVLAARCLAADARVCPAGESCGLEGCEADQRDSLPDYLTTDAGNIDRGDGGPVVCTAICDDECVDTNTDPAHCGGCGMSCPSPAGGFATCAAAECGVGCEEGFHACADACVSSFSVDTCGGSCEPCAAPSENGAASCDGTACGFICDPGFQVSGDGCSPGPNVEPPRPIAPLFLSRVTSLRPSFRWSLAGGTDGALLQVCRDRACTEVVVSQEATGDSLRLRTELTPAPSGSRHFFYRLFGRAGGATGATPSVTGSFVLPARDRDNESALGVINDLNGDGLADIAIGSEDDTVRILLGRAGAAPELMPGALTQTGGSEFGKSLAAVGDLDGDGYGDLAIGAPGIRRVYVYRGGPTGLATDPPTILVGPPDSGFGETVAAAGDLNGDGYADLAVGGPESSQVFVFRGSSTFDTSVDATLSGDGSEQLGAAIAALGDVDGDGFGELAVGAPSAGAVLVFAGSGSFGNAAIGDARQRLDGSAIARFGGALAGGLDVNGDGRGDLLVSAPDAGSGEDVVRLFVGSADGLVDAEKGWPSVAGPTFGRAIAGLGDVDQDGFDDWMVGAPGAAEAFLHRGGEDGGATDAALRHAPVAQMRFGDAIAGPGDVDGDGSADEAVGAPGSRSMTVYRNAGAMLDRMGGLVPESATVGFGAALAKAKTESGGEEVRT